MLRYLFLFLTSILSFSAHASEADEPDYQCVIENFTFIATVHEDNSWSVTEKVRANFIEPRHGIYQYIESRYIDVLDGELYKYSIDVTDIQVPAYIFDTEMEKDFQVIRIGDPDVNITGVVDYTINYTLHFNDDRYAKADILYASILGAQWRNDISEFQFVINFDKSLPSDLDKGFSIHSGPLGTVGNALNVTYKIDHENNSIYGHAENIGHHNGISIHATLPQGFWHVDQSKITANNEVSQMLFYGAIALFIVTAAYLYKNRRRKPTAIIEYKAPDDISSAAVGYIMDDVADVSDLSSLIVWWASKGYLTIEEKEVEKGLMKRKKKQIILHMVQDLPHEIQGYQRQFWKALFKGDNTECNINEDLRDRGKEIKEAIAELEMHFTGSRKLVVMNKTAMILMLLYVVCGALSIFLSSRVSTLDYEYLMAVVAWLLMMLGYGYWRYRNADKTLKEYLRESKKNRIMLLLSMVFMCYYSLKVISSLYSPQNNILPQFAMEGIIAGGWIMVLLVRHIRKDTPYRLEKLSHLLGFREFIKTAELPMLKAMVDENPSYFYEVLPFAMVFGLSDKWYEHFANISISDPDWYVSDSSNSLKSNSAMSSRVGENLSSNFGTLISGGLLASSISLAINAATSSGGGGHSGGGGGGGGGGSW